MGLELRGDSALDGAVAGFQSRARSSQRVVLARGLSELGSVRRHKLGGEIVYSNKSVVSGGSNCYPGRDGRAIAITDQREDYTFKQFRKAVSDLGGEEFA
jgi:hypothetical protein